MDKEPNNEDNEDELDRMWTKHIMACLAIINAWMEEENGDLEKSP